MNGLTYSEALKLFVDMLPDANILYDIMNANDDNYRFCYDYAEDTISYSRISEEYDPYRSFSYFIEQDHLYFYYHDGEIIDIPESKDEWFNFSIKYEHTLQDFENYKKIAEHFWSIYNE